VLKEFAYSPTAYKDLLAKTERLKDEYTKSELSLKRHCAAAFSDTLVAFMHLKAMRVFVESVLRYGVPANFAAFIVKPTSAKNLVKLRSILADVFASSSMFGQSYLGATGENDDETYYSYVNLPFNPLQPILV